MATVGTERVSVFFARASYCERRWNIRKMPTRARRTAIIRKKRKIELRRFGAPASACIGLEEMSLMIVYSRVSRYLESYALLGGCGGAMTSALDPPVNYRKNARNEK